MVGSNPSMTLEDFLAFLGVFDALSLDVLAQKTRLLGEAGWSWRSHRARTRTVCLEGRCSILLSYGTKLGCVQARHKDVPLFLLTQCPSMKKGEVHPLPCFRGPMETAGNH